MDFTAEFLARLHAGETADNLAAELTKAINDANKENERLKAEAEAKRKADEAAEFRARELARDKADAIDSLLIALEKIVAVWGLGDELIEVIEHVDPDEVVQEMDKIKDLVDKYEELFATPNLAAMAYDKPVKPQNPLDEFLNKYVR